MISKLHLFFPELPVQQLFNLLGEKGEQEKIQIQPLINDWQVDFCQSVGSALKKLPLTELRLKQFEVSPTIKTACCCDPVLMQLTHRSAYLLGQAPMNLTQNDAIRIVAQINEKLMGDDEYLYLFDKNSWLYTSEKEKSLSSLALSDLIGKDIFNYPYLDDDATYWQQLSTEIQMLIKQMIDYQGLTKQPSETMLNVHFYDGINPQVKSELPFVSNDNLCVVSDNELIKSFCLNSLLTHATIHSLNDIEQEEIIGVLFDSEQESYTELLNYWHEKTLNKKLVNSSVIFCQDALIIYESKNNFFKKLIAKFVEALK